MESPQTVRHPEIIWKEQAATCIDMVAAVAAACLKVGVDSWAVFGMSADGKAHAWMVVSLDAGDRKYPESRENERFDEWEKDRLASRGNAGEPYRGEALGYDLVEDPLDLRRRIQKWPDSFLIVDPARCCIEYMAPPLDAVCSLDEGLHLLFDNHSHNGRIWCCDIGWWWDGGRIRDWSAVREKEPRRTTAGLVDPSPSLASARSRRGIQVSAVRTTAGIELRERSECVDGERAVMSADGRVLATAVDDGLEIAWVNRFTDEVAAWECKSLDGLGRSLRVLGVVPRGEFGVLAVVSDDGSTWLVEVDRSGPPRAERLRDHPSTAAAIVQGRPWLLIDGRLEAPGRAVAPGDGVEILDFDVAGGIGSEILALLVSRKTGVEVQVIKDLMGKRSVVKTWTKGDELAKANTISIVREFAPIKSPSTLRCGPSGPELTWSDSNGEDSTPRTEGPTDGP